MGLYSKAEPVLCTSPDGHRIYLKDFGDMIRANGQPSPPPASQSSSTSSSPPATPLTSGTHHTPGTLNTPGVPLTWPGTPLTPGTPLGTPTTPTNPELYRHRLPSVTESDSQSSAASDSASVCSSTEWTNFDISPLVKEELRQAIVSRRKTHGLPDVQLDFGPKPLDQLTPEEEERRQLQKERNRSAASKCRTKKRHALGSLVDVAQELEVSNKQLREEMKALEIERVKLRFLLDMHTPTCLMQTASSAISSPQPSTPKRSRVATSHPQPATIHSPTSEEVKVHAATMNAKALPATLPGAQSPPGCESLLYMPPTPSTTYSQSSTGPPTPTLLSPTRVVDAPTFLASSPVSITSIIASPSASADHSFYAGSEQVQPATYLASLDTLSSRAITTTTRAVNTITAAMDAAVFPPVVPPTPEMADEDPFSVAFVNQYLGDDAFGAADLSLPFAADNTTVTEDFLTDLPMHVGRSDTDVIHPLHEQSIQVAGSISVVPLSEKLQADLPLTQPPSTCSNRFAIEDASAALTQFSQHSHQSPPVVHDDVALPSITLANASSPISEPITAPGQEPLTLSFSAILGISFQDMDATIEDVSTPQPCSPSPRVQQQPRHLSGVGGSGASLDFQSKTGRSMTSNDERSNTS